MRLLALLGALLFLFGRTGEEFGVGACPHHGLAALAGAVQHGAPPAGHGPHDHGHAGAAEHTPEPGSPHRHAGPCTCGGPCHADTLDRPADPPSYRWLALVRLDGETDPPPAESPRPRLVSFLLPYPNAPPPGV